MTGSRVGLLWPWPVACLSTNKDTLAFLAHHTSANVATLPEHLCMSHFLSWSFCKLSEEDSSELVISSLIVLPSWPGDAVIPMRPSGMLPRTILVLSCEAFGCTPSSVAVLACLSSFCSLPAFAHDAPFAKILLAGAVRFYRIRPRIVRLDAASWGLRLLAWIHGVLGAVAVIPWNPKNQKKRSCLPPTWTKEELGKREPHRTLLWSRVSLLSSPTPTSVWLVGDGLTSCLDIRRFHHRWFSCSAGWSS